MSLGEFDQEFDNSCVWSGMFKNYRDLQAARSSLLKKNSPQSPLLSLFLAPY